jgi:hypothetical protein
MAGAVHDGARGGMNTQEHRATFSVFLKLVEWGTVLIVATVALLTVAFAMGLGWLATVIGSLVLMGIGGGIVALAFPAKTAAAALSVAVV